MPGDSRPILEVFNLHDLQALFVQSHAAQDERRERARQIERQAQAEAQLLEARRRRSMTNTIDGLGDQIQAALAATRHVQDKALLERRREKELAAAQDEARQARRTGSRIGG